MNHKEFKRPDGRAFAELRPIEARTKVIPNADGSAYFKIGNTTAYAAVYGPRELHPKFLQDPKTGILRCYYNMMPFSGMGDRVRPGINRRAKEISLVMEKALLPVIDLTEYPNSVVDVFVELSETDAGSRCAAISAAAMALAEAGIVMKDMVSAVAVGSINGNLVADLSYEEEAYDGQVADIPVAMLHNSKEISLLQADGEITPDQLKQVLELAKQATETIYQVQREAILRSYSKDQSEEPL